ncbi:chemotaxis protein CheW, partial [bacterium]|nr:chemotaxis protein CheW [bacterium]
RVIVIDYEDSRLGLAVDSVQYVNEISLNEIDDPPEQAITDRNRFLSGIGHIDNSLVFLIDISKIFAEEKGKLPGPKELFQMSS